MRALTPPPSARQLPFQRRGRARSTSSLTFDEAATARLLVTQRPGLTRADEHRDDAARSRLSPSLPPPPSPRRA
eukprot:2185498-Pleurochrysis_carterae.AAC.2